jgi:hypothetical protein
LDLKQKKTDWFFLSNFHFDEPKLALLPHLLLSPKGLTVVGTSQGSPYPESVSSYLQQKNSYSAQIRVISATNAPVNGISDPDLADSIARAEERINRITTLNTDSEQRGQSWCLPVDHTEQARTPLWTGRAKWQRQVRELLNTPTGTDACRQHQVDPQRVFAVAVTMAGFAEQRTGRRVAASRTALAERTGTSVSVVQRARRVLSALHVAKEMARGRFLRTIECWAAGAHHGGHQTRAASVWALISPKSVLQRLTSPNTPTETSSQTTPQAPECGSAPTKTYPQTNIPDPLSVVLAFSSSSSVRKNYTNARTRKGHQKKFKTRKPKPLNLQRAAAELIRYAPALMPHGHIGVISNALIRHSIDTNRWSGRDIARTLTEDTKLRGWIWPNISDLKDPVRFLHWRLARIDWSVPSPTELAFAAKKQRDEDRRTAANEAAARNQRVASPSVREAALALIRATVAGKSRAQ